MSIFYSMSGTAIRTHYNDVFGGSFQNLNIPTTANLTFFTVRGNHIIAGILQRRLVYSREDYSLLADVWVPNYNGMMPVSNDGTKIAYNVSNVLHVRDTLTEEALFSVPSSNFARFIEAEDDTFYVVRHNSNTVTFVRYNWELQHLGQVSFSSISATGATILPVISAGDNFIMSIRNTSDNSRHYLIAKDLSVATQLPINVVGRPAYPCFYQNRFHLFLSSGNNTHVAATKIEYDFDTETLHTFPSSTRSFTATANYAGGAVGPIAWAITGNAGNGRAYNYETNQEIVMGFIDVQHSSYNLQGLIKNSLNQPAERNVALFTKSGILVAKTKSDPVTGAYSLKVGDGFSSLSRVVFSDEPNRNDIIDRINFT